MFLFSFKCASANGKSESRAPSSTGDFRHARCAHLLHSLGGRLACIVSPLSRPRSEGQSLDRCCPYCPVTCTCRSTDTLKTPELQIASLILLKEMEVDGCVLTLYHKEYNRALVMFSRMTRCHDMSSPVERWKTYFIGL